jgi:hypothetical protein
MSIALGSVVMSCQGAQDGVHTLEPFTGSTFMHEMELRACAWTCHILPSSASSSTGDVSSSFLTGSSALPRASQLYMRGMLQSPSRGPTHMPSCPYLSPTRTTVLVGSG